jgi:aminodeoxyfutalosine deaminase
MTKTIHKAKFVLAEPNILFQDSAVHISPSGRITSVEPGRNQSSIMNAEVIDWGSALMIPGLVNAHTHLELTCLKNQLTNFGSFTDWISKLVNARKNWTRDKIVSSAQEGMRLSLSSGVTLVGDITSSALSCALNNQQLRRVFFEEVLAFAPNRADEVLSSLNLEKETSGHPLSVHGISPHAPYSVSAQLYQGAAQLARIMQKPLSTHAAETLAELQFLKTGTGEFRDFLLAMNLLPADWKPPGLAPIAYLDSLGVLGPSCLLAHCNYLDEESIETIANSHSHVVYCPRSHYFFGHENHPIRSLLDSGISVSLGTDSLASNESLSMIEEMRFLFKIRKDLRPEEILRAATLNGAVALGFDGVLGRLESGYWADIAILEIPNEIGPQRLIEQVFEGAGDCIATIVQGKIAWRKDL